MILRSSQGCSWIKLYIMSTFPSPSRPKDKSTAQLPYDPEEYPREKSRHYISVTSSLGYTHQFAQDIELRIPEVADSKLSPDKEVVERKLGNMMSASVATQVKPLLGLKLKT